MLVEGSLGIDAPVHVFDTYEDLESFCQEGSPKYPLDNPRAGEIGYAVYDGGRRFVWRPFGEVTPEDTLVSSKDPKDIIEALLPMMSHRAFKCDCVIDRTLGFVHYDTPGKATIVRFPMAAMKIVRGIPATTVKPVRDWLDVVPVLWMSSVRELRSILG
jgi:hypothetical protein